jgi:hypothetical protein
MHGCIIYELYATLINLSPTAYKEKDKTKKREEERKGHSSYYCNFSPTSLGRLRVANGGTLHDSDPDGRWVWV